MDVFITYISRPIDKFKNLVSQLFIGTQNSEFKKYCGIIDSLAFLVLDKVLNKWLKEDIPFHAGDLLFYFDF